MHFLVATSNIIINQYSNMSLPLTDPPLHYEIPRGLLMQLGTMSRPFGEGGKERVDALILDEGITVTLPAGSWCHLDELDPDELELREVGPLGNGTFGHVVDVTLMGCERSHLAEKIVRAEEFDLKLVMGILETSNFHYSRSKYHFTTFVKAWKHKDQVSILMIPRADRDLEDQLQLVASKNTGFDFTNRSVQLLRWIYCLADALSDLHKDRLIHGDIKTGNILIHDDMILFTDYGIAAARRVAPRPDITTTGTSSSHTSTDPVRKCDCELEHLLKTDALVNPFGDDDNIAELAGLRGPKGDVYSLGWAIYEMLLASTPRSLQNSRLPCRPTAQQLAWYRREELIRLINDFCGSLVEASRTVGQECEKYAVLTKDLFGIVMNRMTVLREKERCSSYEVLVLIREAMYRQSVKLNDCCRLGYVVGKLAQYEDI
ncbi:kinase-like domain-containing protein [Hyaloscypha finlandica]|nr:kinase-like domain-containing protein [Hyaloscypha finlandica]